MRKLTAWIAMGFALTFLGACQTATSLSDGTGYKRLNPSGATSKFILRNDVPFARQVTAHNRQCAKDAGCK